MKFPPRKEPEQIIEIQYLGDDSAFWWPVCAREGCKNHRTHDDTKYCYPHSRWWRPLIIPFNRLLSILGV